ncbi:MAG: hypothetical protein ACOY7J_08085, partial [Pseudomonadota bacterium]
CSAVSKNAGNADFAVSLTFYVRALCPFAVRSHVHSARLVDAFDCVAIGLSDPSFHAGSDDGDGPVSIDRKS